MSFAFKRELERTKPLAPGYWRPLDASGQWSASVACPVCGLVGSLVDHTIDAVGHVSPSIACPNTPDDQIHVACSFHVDGRLLDWPPSSDPPTPWR